MRRPLVIFGLLAAILVLLLWALLTDNKTASIETQTASEPQSEVPQDTPTQRTESVRVKTKPPVPRFEALPASQPEKSESEQLAEGGLSTPQRDYPEKPDPPEFEMPSGPDIMPFAYQRLLFKNAPDKERMGLALYVTLNHPDDRKLAFLHRRYLQQLTAFLASKYDYSAVQTDAGKQRFIEMLEVRFKRRVKGGMIKQLESAFFDEETGD